MVGLSLDSNKVDLMLSAISSMLNEATVNLASAPDRFQVANRPRCMVVQYHRIPYEDRFDSPVIGIFRND